VSPNGNGAFASFCKPSSKNKDLRSEEEEKETKNTPICPKAISIQGKTMIEAFLAGMTNVLCHLPAYPWQ
jgi:hypothetical protein